MNGLITLGIILIIAWGIQYLIPYDDTDNKLQKKRSGLSLYVDNRTGLHYIKGRIFGTIIPRLNAEEKQIKGK